jgi:hypothetical protein
MVMGPARPETKNDCAAEDHQQFTRADMTRLRVARFSHNSEREKDGFLRAYTKNSCAGEDQRHFT